MSLQLNTSTYPSFNTKMTDLLKAGQYCGVCICLYQDEAKTIPFTKSNITIMKQKLVRINCTATFKAKNGDIVKPCVDLIFSENLTMTIIDEEDTCWCTLEGILTPSRF